MSKTLLLADDSVTIQKVVGITFASEDIDLVTVDNGDDALARAREIRPDLVLADVSMPGLNGYELCHAIKNDVTLSGTPVVLLTGTFEVQDDSRAAQAGADAQIAKPFEAQALVDLVRGLIASGGGPAQAPVQPMAPAAAAPPVAEPAAAEPLPAPDPEPLSAPVADDGPAARATPEAPAEAPAAASEAQSGPPTGDTDFSFSDLEFAKVATAGPPPDATQVMGGIPPLAPDAAPSVEPLDAPEFSLGGIEEEPLSIDPIESAESEVPTSPRQFSPAPISSGGSMTQPRLQRSDDDLMLPDGDAVPEIEMTELEPLPADDALEFDKTHVIDPDAAGELLEAANLEAIPEEPIAGSDSGSARNRGGDPMLQPDAAGVDSPVTPDPEPIPAAEISSEMWHAPPEVEPLGERTVGGSEIFGALLQAADRSMGASLDEQTEPDADPVLEPVALPEAEPATQGAVQSGLEPAQAQAVRDSIEKLAWDAFGPISEQLVREVVKKIEEIAWDVVPQLAEKIVQQEIRRLTKSDD